MARKVVTKGIAIGTVAPPPRTRNTQPSLTGDMLDALAAALNNADPKGADWVSNGHLYVGEDAQNDAVSEARIYRRDVARHRLNVSESKIRTRVWQDGDGWRFGLLRKAENGAQ